MRTFFSRATVIPFLFFLLLAPLAYAKEPPDVLLKQLTQEVIVELRQHDQDIHSHPKHLYDIIDRILVPYIDWEAMSQWVVGRDAWKRATPQQRIQFSAEFRELLIRTYASTLKAYKNQSIEYLPVRGGVGSKSRVQVNSLIRESGRQPIKVSYRMADKGDAWKVYDISIEGVSLLQGFQSQFSTEIRQQGLNGLIMRLHRHNERPLR
ncbi:MAG: phospholipid-binding protein MlaC [Candidatus Berkiellales bacterium]